METNCITRNFKMQTPSGGYDQLAKFLGAEVIGRPTINSLPGRVVEKAWHFAQGNRPHLFSHLGHGYRFEDRVCEERAFWRAFVRRPNIVHALYGDWAMDILLRRTRFLRSQLVATFHLPAQDVAERFERKQKEALRALRGAVSLSSADLPAYTDWLGRDRVTFIPHGIDTDVFRPTSFSPRKPARFLFVGMMLRDFETAHRVMDRCRADCVQAEFIVVIPESGRSFFTGCTNAKIVSQISESELIALYRECDALLLPLLNSTANNAILEAMACGLPVISTRIGGVSDYVNESCGWLLPLKAVDAAYECVRCIVRHREIAVEKRGAARFRAELFSWKRIAAMMRDAYRRLWQTGIFAIDFSPSVDNSLDLI